LEQTFKAPNFYSTETDLSIVTQPGPSGTPACVIGSTQRGPAFVPITVANIDDANARELVTLKLKHDRELEEIKNQFGEKKDYAELEKQLL